MNRKLQIILVSCFAILTLFSCKTTKHLTYFENADSLKTSIQNLDYALKLVPFDELQITVNSLVPEATAAYNLPLFNPVRRGTIVAPTQEAMQTYQIDKDGNILFPVLGELHVAGMSTKELTDMLYDKISKEVEDPLIKVNLMNFRVNVLGEVNSPGAKSVSKERYTLFDAIADAGDLTLYGQRENVLLIREENGVRTFHRMNLKDANIVNSPYFYLQQNDVLYVEPNKTRSSNSEYNSNNSFKVSVVSTIVSALSVIASLVIALVVNK